MTNRKCLTALTVFFCAVLSSSVAVAGVANTKHNLSVTGPGTYKATSEKQLCVFCHAPHNTNPSSPLWNHAMSAATYTPYTSLTLAAAAPGQPTGASKLCLSCHDGTVALGSVQNMPGSDAGTIAGLTGFLLGTPTEVGTDLRNDHPVSFLYDAALAVKNPELVTPASLPAGKVKPDSTGQVQCTGCHDPHSDTNPKFMLSSYKDAGGYGSPLCRTCHNKQYWGTVPSMPHRESIAQWTGAGLNPWHIAGQNLALNANSTPKANGCESCHQPHNGAGPSRILKQDGESGVCLVCHNGNVASATKNIDTELNKLYVHPAKTYTGRHNPKRQADGKVREDTADLNNRHAECADCHNPHAVSAGVSPSLPSVTNNLTSNVLKGVWGVQPTWPGNFSQVTAYTPVDDIQYQYQLCLKCHSYYAFGLTPPGDPYSMVVGGANTDQAKEFNPNNASFHPVAAPGKNLFKVTVGGDLYNYSSSLINGLTPTSTFTCTDCHNPTAPGVAGPKGPHGANYWPILFAQWDHTTNNGSNSTMCFSCHKETSYRNCSRTDYKSTGFSSANWESKWNLHCVHVNDEQLPCVGCHSAVPHGSRHKALLVFGTGPGTDPEPYNVHRTVTVKGTNKYGLPSKPNQRGEYVDQIPSGNYQRNSCHFGNGDFNINVTSVGGCGPGGDDGASQATPGQ